MVVNFGDIYYRWAYFIISFVTKWGIFNDTPGYGKFYLFGRSKKKLFKREKIYEQPCLTVKTGKNTELVYSFLIK